MSKEKYTIKDIAQMAGVSKGTVDRVLHKRGKVSKEAFEKVNNILNEIDFTPNPIARNLKNNKVYRICVLIPDAKIDPYWLPSYEGLKEATNEFQPFGVSVEKYYYHPNKPTTFMQKAKDVINSSPDALLMAPLFHKESLIISQACKKNKIYVTLFNNLIDTLNTDNFIGQDLYQTGRVAASLIDKITVSYANIAIIHVNEEPHMRQKEIGFKDYFKEKQENNHKLVTYNLNTDNADNFEKEVQLFFDSYPLVTGIFITNSMAYKLAAHIDKKNKKICLVGYDLLEENIVYMQKGTIDFLIHQKPKQQAYLAVSLLAENLLFRKELLPKELLPIDIVTSENVQYYLN